ncbi:hypothetical protein EHV15_36060 [Paenibacillus oralis]|uniref:Uncharacterized protein n=1 Tax=Paenibacillus oralis TaxID=2490856 RepID=A0A3P3TA99_9BACL|nr:hypothetical protein [Paenibacillus oralis]RRJ54985.1 hypothetical protein EHV15_36060 [Paenibacillus oralis]
MNLKKVQMTWVEVLKLPSPFKFGKGAVRVNRYDNTRVYFEFPGQVSENLREIYRQIRVWLLNSRCVSIQFTYEGTMPIKELTRLKFTRSSDKIWRMQHDLLSVVAIPIDNAGTWILSIENRTGKKGVPVDACDLPALFSVQLSIDADGEVIGS